jgi:hypothetical protein
MSPSPMWEHAGVRPREFAPVDKESERGGHNDNPG